MGRRLDLDALLREIIGNENVYFQAPSNINMKYPCIVYERDDEDKIHADNAPYRRIQRYQVTIIDRNPDSEIPDKVAMQPLTGFSRHFVADGLHHDVYNLYF